MTIEHRPIGREAAAGGFSGALERNIEALVEHRRKLAAESTFSEKLSETVSRFAGSMSFVVIHAIIYGFWIVANLGWIPGVPAWDPSMVVLAMIASVEAIFLSTFILISQNRLADVEDKRNELSLQVSLLAEHEITKLVAMVSDIADKLNVSVDTGELSEIKQDVAPEAVLQRIEEVREEAR